MRRSPPVTRLESMLSTIPLVCHGCGDRIRELGADEARDLGAGRKSERLAASCKSAPAYNVEQQPFATASATLEQRAEQIRRAGVSAGWMMAEVAPGQMRGKYNFKGKGDADRARQLHAQSVLDQARPDHDQLRRR
jgi:hypothetical protein